jgi:quercetin dioxygenase-like cupin family protein
VVHARCRALHHGIVIRGQLHAVMNEGTEDEFGPGDVYYLPPGHDAWVVGNESYEAVDFGADPKWAKSS